MQPYREIVTSGLHDFFRKLPQPGIQYIITAVEFNWRPAIRLHQVKLEDPPVWGYCPDGRTALYDGIATALRLEASRSDPVLCLIASDGEENHSLTTEETITRLVHERASWKNWTFLCLNMQGDRNFEADLLGIQTLDFSREEIGAELARLAQRISRETKRLHLEQGRALEVRALLP
jgi:hypothetical protein